MEPRERVKTRKRLYAELAGADWRILYSHFQRNALLTISGNLDLVEAGVSFAEQDSEQIWKWFDEGKLSRPTPKQVSDWNENPKRQFLFLVCRDYVIAAEQPPVRSYLRERQEHALH